MLPAQPCSLEICHEALVPGRTFYRSFDGPHGLEEKHFCSLACLARYRAEHPDPDQSRTQHRSVRIDGGGQAAY